MTLSNYYIHLLQYGCNCNDSTVGDRNHRRRSQAPFVPLIALNAMASRWPHDGHFDFSRRGFVVLRRNLRRHGALRAEIPLARTQRKANFKNDTATISQFVGYIDS